MSCFQKQLLVHKLPLPVDVLHIVYDYCFKHVMDVQRKKKAALLNVIKKQTYTETIVCKISFHDGSCRGRYNTINVFSVYPKNVSAMCWGISSMSQPETYLSSDICSKCGDFLNPKTKRRNKSSMRDPWKRQCSKNAISPFSKVTCKDECHYLKHFT